MSKVLLIIRIVSIWLKDVAGKIETRIKVLLSLINKINKILGRKKLMFSNVLQHFSNVFQGFQFLREKLTCRHPPSHLLVKPCFSFTSGPKHSIFNFVFTAIPDN